MKRPIITTIDTILAVLKDYTAGQIPTDGQAVGLKFKPTEQGKLGIEVFSENWPDPGDGPIEVKFEMKRMYGVQ